MKKPKDVDQYIASYPEDIQKILKQLRSAIKKAAPKADEVISYGMPAYKLNGILAWFAAHSKHTGFYPGASGIAAFKKELSVYKSAKGSVQFPFEKPLPLRLITKIIKFRIREINQKMKLKKK